MLTLLVPELQAEGPEVWEAGFGSLYWMEGVTFRLQVGGCPHASIMAFLIGSEGVLCNRDYIASNNHV